jgi:uncharacterized membrane protein YeaQ/YmgE (transglycosylase-associated protein family)
MTVSGIVTALIVGVTIGYLGRFAIPGARHIPIWLTVVVAVIAAMLGTVLAGLAGMDTDGDHLLRLVIQVGLAGVALAVLATVASRRHPGRR